MQFVVFMGTMNFLFYLYHGGVRKCGVILVKDASHASRPKI